VLFTILTFDSIRTCASRKRPSLTFVES